MMPFRSSNLVAAAACVLGLFLTVQVKAQECSAVCSDVYNDGTILGLCVELCESQPDLFDVDFPYLLGPLTMQPYAELTNSDPDELKELTGKLWVRVSADRLRMQFYLVMDSNPSPFFPYFA